MATETPPVKEIPKRAVRFGSFREFVSPEGTRYLLGGFGSADLFILPNLFAEPGKPGFCAYIAPHDSTPKPKIGDQA